MEFIAADVTLDEIDPLLNTLQEIGRTHDCIVQAFDSRFIASEAHLEKAVQMTRRAIERDTMIADDPSVELLLFVAGNRQIERAIEIGIGEETDSMIIVVDGKREEVSVRAIRDAVGGAPGELSPDPDRLREWFDITVAEEECSGASLSDLICERVALLQLDA